MNVKNKIIAVFTVKKQELITPHYMRITFLIPERLVEQLKGVKEGSNNKLFIPPMAGLPKRIILLKQYLKRTSPQRYRW